MSISINWPALKALSEESVKVRCERAAYGKVFNAATDYRWMGRTDGFPPVEGLAEELSLGTEKPGSLFCWKATRDGYYAVRCYPSKALDRTGRPTALEKQVLWCPRSPAVPVALQALAALSRDAITTSNPWDEWQDTCWQDNQYVARLEAEEELAIPPSETRELISEGLSELGSVLGPPDVAIEALTTFYAALLSENRPAPLRLLGDNSLKAKALAVLLLPLEDKVAASISIAGGLPSTDLPQKSARNWDGIAVPPGGLVFWKAAVDVPRANLEHARRIARALYSGNPAELCLHELVSNNFHDLAATPVVADASDLPLVDLANRPTELSASLLALEDFVFGQERSVGAMDPDKTKNLELVPESEIPYLYWLFREFDRAIENRRSASMDDDSPLAHCLKHLGVKSDLIRSWMYMLAPGDVTAEKVNSPATDRVPLLWMAAAQKQSEAFERLGLFSKKNLEELEQQSERVLKGKQGFPQLERKRLEEFLTAWRAHGAKSSVKLV